MRQQDWPATRGLPTERAPGLPEAQGLYDPSREHDNCGIGFIANIKNRKSHDIVRQGIQILVNLDHRGAVGADPLAGDGAGILMQIPDRFFRAEVEKLGFNLPEVGAYGVAMVFLPRAHPATGVCQEAIERTVRREGQEVLGWRDVPVDSAWLGESVKPITPVIRQVFIGRGPDCVDVDSFERKLYVIRKQAHHVVWDADLGDIGAFYIPSISARTIIYKGMVLAPNLAKFYLDLQDERMESALALVHQRFSTNTFPSWPLAQPFRYLCHNGEINTVRGNINWMMARRHSMLSKVLGDDLEKLWPLIGDGASDSATFDNALELLVAGGYSLAHAMMMMIPEAWDGHPLMDEKRRAFYEYHAALMEPWDGPAAIAFTDGRQIGATLDRNGLRPARYIVTDDDHVVLGSEVGVLPYKEENIVSKWRLQPGKMLLIDLEQGRIVDDAEVKETLAAAKPYREWLNATQIKLENLPPEVSAMAPDRRTLLDRQQAFGYNQEDLKFFLMPMAEKGEDPVGSMGRDIPPAVLSDRPKVLFDYFHQNFAQVTNPPVDPIREESVMSMVSLIGPRPNLLDLETGGSHKRLEVRQPILSNGDLEKVRRIEHVIDADFHAETLSICYPVRDGAKGMEKALAALCERAKRTVEEGHNILVLSDRGVNADNVAIPSLLATAAVHHFLIRAGLRTEVGLVVETGEVRKVHDFCLLAGYGAEAINPYLALDTLSALRHELSEPMTKEYEIHKRYIKAISKGMMKVMSKMGISTYQSYCGAQIFDAVGLNSAFVDKYFTKTATQIEGIGLDEVAEETVRRHAAAFGDDPVLRNALDVGGEYAFRLRGEEHVWNPETVGLLQHSVRSGNYEGFKRFTAKVNDQSKKLRNLRGLFKLKRAGVPVPLDEVEPASEIVKRFATGAMSFGSISWEAHTTLAIAMNRMGGKSNTGEGGEDGVRYKPLENGDSMKSAIKQVASGRFGVTTEYLVNADDLQIKMAQGAKPGEGGQLPGHKVDKWIARVRHSTPGVGLISPPPHHDIYSIEDLAQLIHDLKNVNPQARISVKLVSEVGVGTVAAGVSKAHADHVTISGNDGGTGASPLTSIMNAGSFWEIGLAETHQTLVLNQLRGRIAVQVDGGLRTGRDVVIGALLGADEFGFATAALISSGCIMMRKCHLNTCPAGVATQDPELRKRFTGQPEHVINFFTFIAEEVREIMAELGFRTVNEMIGRMDRLDARDAISHWKAKGLDFSLMFAKPSAGPDVATYNCEKQDHGLDKALDNKLIELAKPALESGNPVQIEMPVRNVNRTVGAMLSGEVAKRYGHAGLPDDTIHIAMTGTAGQSFGAWLAKGVTLDLVGDANDYVGKGLSGGRIVVRPSPKSPIVPEDNIIVGNTVLYGAISGECYFHGVAGERFAVRNSGAIAVIEGVGDHGCEYMTGGCVVVLGSTGRNFAAGMSGGIAYVLDEAGDFVKRCNGDMIQLEPISAKTKSAGAMAFEDIFDDVLGDDARRLKTLIERYVHYTDSARAKMILENWDEYLPKFLKILPVDYKRALLELRAEQAAEAAPALNVAAGE
jgi:glutamate synthase (NADPH/NADH) large chain